MDNTAKPFWFGGQQQLLAILLVTLAAPALPAPAATAAPSVKANVGHDSANKLSPRPTAPMAKSLQLAVNSKGKPRKPRRNAQRIEVLVNDEPITGYEIDQRAGLLAARSSNVAKRIQSRATAR
ncbi:MAG: hypothetical protein K0U34_02030, partial [Alphaproteobacteria bacterium]|nr:hypothetical protein [Alphaproteobacteria bacterium]